MQTKGEHRHFLKICLFTRKGESEKASLLDTRSKTHAIASEPSILD
jgi:hypothetical protein